MKTFTFEKITNPQTLEDEIRLSPITVALSTVIAYGDGSTTIYMKDDLTESDSALLSTVVAAHDAVAVHDDVPMVEVMEERGNRTQGNYQASMWKWDIEACTPGTTIDLESKSFPFPVSALSLEWFNSPEVNGDHCSLLISPDAVVGTTTAPVTSGSDIVFVSDTVLGLANMGYVYELVNGEVSYKPGRAILVNKGDGSIQFENTIPVDFPAGSLVKQTVELATKVYLLDKYIPELGSNRIGGTHLPANTPMVVRYTNVNGAAKGLCILMEYIY